MMMESWRRAQDALLRLERAVVEKERKIARLNADNAALRAPIAQAATELDDILAEIDRWIREREGGSDHADG